MKKSHLEVPLTETLMWTVEEFCALHRVSMLSLGAKASTGEPS
jgi:hypothetical protein